MNNIIRFALVLFIVTLVAASVLAGVYSVTRTKIEVQQHLIEEEALRYVMPESIGDRVEPVKENGAIKYWKVFKGTDYRPTGYIFIAKKYGYSSIIETMVGMKTDGTITGARILNQSETPGLGAKIVEAVSGKTIFKALKELFSKAKTPKKDLAPYFTEQFKGRDIRNIDIGNIDAITGATISSKAVVDSIKSEGIKVLEIK